MLCKKVFRQHISVHYMSELHVAHEAQFGRSYYKCFKFLKKLRQFLMLTAKCIPMRNFSYCFIVVAIIKSLFKKSSQSHLHIKSNN